MDIKISSSLFFLLARILFSGRNTLLWQMKWSCFKNNSDDERSDLTGFDDVKKEISDIKIKQSLSGRV